MLLIYNIKNTKIESCEGLMPNGDLTDLFLIIGAAMMDWYGQTVTTVAKMSIYAKFL